MTPLMKFFLTLLVAALFGLAAFDAAADESPVTLVPVVVAEADGSISMAQAAVVGGPTTLLCFAQAASTKLICLRSIGPRMYKGKQVGVRVERFETTIAISAGT